MSFPNLGKFFPQRRRGARVLEGREKRFAMEIAAALQRASVESGLQIKTVAGWTGANERTVKNWFSGQYGPSGEHLLVLAGHSHEVFKTMLGMMERQDLLVALEFVEIEDRIARLMMLMQELKDKGQS
ncbi:hypothetical protein ACE10Z_01145 [Bradyrhizobium sp. Pha-3]|uniref:hypothetical protein n=1 Tax=Bradyrhizobium sp. Pha-3 TaxID=208375 RepID=UPI0035D42AB0